MPEACINCKQALKNITNDFHFPMQTIGFQFSLPHGMGYYFINVIMSWNLKKIVLEKLNYIFSNCLSICYKMNISGPFVFLKIVPIFIENWSTKVTF